MKLLRSLAGHQRTLLRVFGRRHFAASPQEYDKRNYANNVDEYNSVFTSLTAQRKHFLLRDAYDDMVLDGVHPSRDVFHSLIVGTMKGSRLQDALFFRDEMKAMGLVPDVALYNFLISTCVKCNYPDQAIRILEEMKIYDVKPNGQTYVCLLNACAAAGRLDRVYAIVRDMTSAGLGLNKFCYAGLITAHMNQRPPSDDTATKIIEFVERSKEWSSAEASGGTAENIMMRVTDEELYNLPTAEYVNRRGFVNRPLTMYHVAFHACANLKNVKVMNTLLEMLKKDGKDPDLFIDMQIMRCYLHSGDFDQGLNVFETKGNPPVDLYLTLVEGAMLGNTPKGMQIAQDTLEKMNARGFYLTPKIGSDLLLSAAGEKTGGYITANYIWDMMQAQKLNPSFPAVDAYYKGLKDREIPKDDPRLLLVSRLHDSLRRFGRTGDA